MNDVVIGRNELKQIIMKNGEKEGKIIEALIEITAQCNYSCEYCYIHGSSNKQMMFSDYCLAIDELSQNGCVYLTISGGEPLTHPDFSKIYLYARSKIPFVTIFTNGSLFTEETIDLLSSYKPYDIEVSLYGTKKESYDAFVKRKGAFSVLERNLAALETKCIPYSLKTTLTTISEPLSYYTDYAKKRKVSFRFDSMVIPSIDNTEPFESNLRLSANAAVQAVSRQREYIEKLKEKYLENKAISHQLYTCSAGINSILIDVELNVGLCVAARTPSYSLRTNTLEKIHLRLMSCHDRELSSTDKCYDCELKLFCRYCPGRFEKEGYSVQAPPPWTCQYASALADIIKE